VLRPTGADDGAVSAGTPRRPPVRARARVCGPAAGRRSEFAGRSVCP
jgi:hypothetical protein